MKHPPPGDREAPQQARDAVAPARVEASIAVFAFGALVAITAANVIIRYFTNRSFAWTEEISIYLMVVVTLAGSAFAAAQDRHIRVTVVSEGGSEARRTWLALASATLSTLVFLGLAVLLAWLVRDEFVLGETSTALGLPRWWYTSTLVALAGALATRSAIWGLRRAQEDRMRRRAGWTP